MSENRAAWLLLLTALALGLLGDYLLRAPLWGLNVALGLTAMALVAFVCSLRPTPGLKPRSQGARWPWGAAVFFAAMWAVRDAELLLVVDLLAALSLACLPLIPGGHAGLRQAGVLELVAAALGTAWRTATGGADLIRSLGPLTTRRAVAVGLGLLLSIPFVLGFGALFVSADPLFGRVVSSLIGVELERLLSHPLLIAALTWAAAGYLWTHMGSRPLRFPAPPAVRLGGTQVITVLGATALVFAFFVAVQAGSLFGGEAFIRNQTGLTYAEYARRGFFQIVLAAGLSLPLVYVAPFVVSPSTRRAAVLHALMSIQLGLTTLVLASALWRFGLYVRAYGLTEDRLYGAAVLLWIAATIAIFVATVLRGRPAGAAYGTIVAAMVILVALNLANPAALIARYHLSHQERRAADIAYLARLGADAVPTLVSRLEDVAPGDRCTLAKSLIDRYRKSSEDWRGWNLARLRARRAVVQLDPFARSCP